MSKAPTLVRFLPGAVLVGGVVVAGAWWWSSSAQATVDTAQPRSGLPRLIPLPMGSFGISSPYMKNRVSPVDGVVRDHNGIDLRAPTGTPIYSTEDGIVQKVSHDPGGANGMYVSVKGAEGYHWYYLHMSQIGPVAVGQFVRQGDLLGYVGQTGRATGPHLHLQVYAPGGYTTTVDPAQLIDFNSLSGKISEGAATARSAMPYAAAATGVGLLVIAVAYAVSQRKRNAVALHGEDVGEFER